MEGRRWEEMERDCLANIFQRLSIEDLTLGVPIVCRQWLRASMDPLCWRVLDFRSLDFLPWSRFPKRFTTLYSLRRFSFTGFLKLAIDRSRGSVVEVCFPLLGASLEDLVLTSHGCPKLKVLVLPNLLSEDEPHMPELIEKWKELERLDMEWKPSSFLEMVDRISHHCKKFSSLKMHGSIKEEDVTAIVNLLPSLKSLDLSKSYLPKEQLLAIVDGCKELDILIVRNCIGFVVDDGIRNRVSLIPTFDHEGSKSRDEHCYDTDDECDWLRVVG